MEDRFALLIDADNVSAKYIKPILDELSNIRKCDLQTNLRGLDKVKQCELEGRTSSEFYYADSAVQLYAGKEFNRFCHDH